MNQGKLDMVKQKVAREQMDILGFSELKWTEIGEFNSDDHYIYYCGQESLRINKWSSPHSQQESKLKYLCAISKMTEWSQFISKANHSSSQKFKAVAHPLMWRSWSWMVLWRPIRPAKINTKKKKKEEVSLSSWGIGMQKYRVTR